MTILIKNAVKREKGIMYFLTRGGDLEMLQTRTFFFCELKKVVVK